VRRFTFWAVALAVAVIVIFNLQGWLVLRSTSRTLEQEIGDRLQAIGTTLAPQLAGRDSDPAILPLLNEVMAASDLFNLFVVDDDLTYLANARDPTLVGSTDPALELDAPEILSASSGVPTSSRLYAAGGFFLKTAYAPIPDSLGIPVAVLGVEADARSFAALRRFRDSQLLISALSLIAIVAIVVVSIGLARHALRVEQAASRANTLALMGQLSAALAHEIRNPLAIIRAAAERVGIRYDATEDQTLGYIIEEVDRLNNILGNYLSLGSARPESVEPVELARLAADVLAAVEPETRRLGISVETALEDLPPVSGNRLALRQVLLNLVLNAIQAQPDGGLLRLTGSTETRAGRQWVVVRVADRGPGMKPEDLKQAFAPFYTTREKGSGLGLFVVRRVVEEHRGRVAISSGPDQGTTVEVRLPA